MVSLNIQNYVYITIAPFKFNTTNFTAKCTPTYESSSEVLKGLKSNKVANLFKIYILLLLIYIFLITISYGLNILSENSAFSKLN